MKQKVKTGVVGVGGLGQWHAKVYAELPDVELVGIYDRDPARAAEIAARYGTLAFGSLEELASAVHAASVVVPADHHFEVAMPLLDRGVHLLVEKPIATTSADAEAMVTRAVERGLILQVGHVERFNPVLGYLEEQLRRPRYIEAIRLQPYPPPRPGEPPRGTEVSVVLDLMIHDLEVILHLVRAPVAEIRAVGVPVLSVSEDIANVRLEFAGGGVANITASRVSAERMRKIRVFQEDTYLSLDYQEQSGTICRKTGMGISRDDIPIEKGEPLPRELASFAACVRNRQDPVVTGREASDALALALTICRRMRGIDA